MSRLKLTLHYSMNGRNIHQSNSIGFLFEGAPAYNSANAKAVILKLRDAISRVAPDTLHWLRGTSTELDVDGNQVPSHSKSFALQGTGAFAVPAGEELAPPQHVVNVEKENVDVGRPAVTPLRYIITTAELKAYFDDGTIPARLSVASAVNGSPVWSFTDAIKFAGNGQDLTLSMPEMYQGVQYASRPVTSVTIKDIGENKANRDKQSGDANLRAGLQQKINELAKAAHKAKKNDPNGAAYDPTDDVVNDLKDVFHGLYDGLDPVTKAELKVDPILTAPKLIGPV